MSKVCKKCKKNKSLTEFGTRTRSTAKGDKTYVRLRCKQCKYEADEAWRKANRERRNQRARESYARRKAGIKRNPRQTPEEILARQKIIL